MSDKIVQGDCLEVMRDLPDACVDAIVTDPPYGLVQNKRGGSGVASINLDSPYGRSRIGTGNGPGGFMGKEWDSCVPGVPFWAEALRIAKPGAYLVAFGGTRTFHRLACAIEDAGWEIRDCFSWLYGCLSDDTEILIDGEWVPYHKATEGSLALCYDTDCDKFSWHPVERLFVYDYDDVAYRIVSERTDQVVSRNHRCIIERDGRWEFVVAEEVAREREARVPVLEAMPGLLDAVPLRQSNAGDAQPSVPLVRHGEAKSAPQGANGLQAGVRDVRRVPHERFDLAVEAQAREEDDVLSQVQRDAAGSRVGEAWAQGGCGGDCRGAAASHSQDDRSVESCLEGRGDVQAGQGQLHRAKVRPVSCGVSGDGPQGRVRHGASASSSDGVREVSDEGGSCASRRSRHSKQRSVESDALRVESGSQAIRGSGFTESTLARVTPIHYVGKVWCVKVPTGAFVARRNGKVFVTGNSGFPKSLDVSKAIDKAAGAERSVVIGTRGLNSWSKDAATGPAINDGLRQNFDRVNTLLAPATDAAKRWQGWGTALKPAWEPIILARKPLVGTVASNVLAHGTGALNIDGCRIGTSDNLNGGAYKSKVEAESDEDSYQCIDPNCPDATTMPYHDHPAPKRKGRHDGTENWRYKHGGAGDFSQPLGRWPANVVLGCACDGDTHDDDCAAAMLDAQTGVTKSTGGKTSGRNALGQGSGWNAHENRPIEINRPQDSGGASRFFYTAKASRRERGEGNTHPTVKPVALMRWLCRLVCPPGGSVLDPFAGSGTTLLAAHLEGFDYLGIEREAEYVEIVRQRLANVETLRESTDPQRRRKEKDESADESESE